jgi:hypothetical protein
VSAPLTWFSAVVTRLERWRDTLETETRSAATQAERVRLAIELGQVNDAITLLRRCDKHAVDPAPAPTRVPPLFTYGDLHVLFEGDWMKTRADWRELARDGGLLPADADRSSDRFFLPTDAVIFKRRS